MSLKKESPGDHPGAKNAITLHKDKEISGKSKKMQKALDLLKDLDYQDKLRKHPKVPAHCIPKTKYSDRTANGLTKCVIDFLRLRGHQAERISNTGRPLDKRKIITDVIGRARTVGSLEWIPGTGTNGTADVSATIRGRAVKVEIKMKDSQSPAQKSYQAAIEQAGGIYLIVRTFQEFFDWYINWMGGRNE